MKLNEVHFSSGAAVTHFLDKPYQEINVKSHTSFQLVNKKNAVKFAHVRCDFISLYFILFTFTMRLKSFNYKSH